jgi:hypothetical protein
MTAMADPSAEDVRGAWERDERRVYIVRIAVGAFLFLAIVWMNWRAAHAPLASAITFARDVAWFGGRHAR